MAKDSFIDQDSKVLFESERCYVRPFAEDDLDEFMVYRNNPEWMKYQSFKGLSKKEYEEILLEPPSAENGAQFAIRRKADHCLLGDVYMKKEVDTFWIGYTISPSFKRQGYAFEVVNAMIRWINRQGDYKIHAGVLPENTASVRLLEKIGFSQIDEENGDFIYAWNPDS